MSPQLGLTLLAGSLAREGSRAVDGIQLQRALHEATTDESVNARLFR